VYSGGVEAYLPMATLYTIPTTCKRLGERAISVALRNTTIDRDGVGVKAALQLMSNDLPLHAIHIPTTTVVI